MRGWLPVANGTIRPDVVFPSTGSFKLQNGIIIAWGQVAITTSTQGSTAIFPYRGSVAVDVSGYGISSIICAFANVRDGAGYWNATVSTFSGSNMDVTAGGNQNATKTVSWLCIGT